MKFTIKDRYNDSGLFEIEADSFVKAVEAAVKSRANLTRANLTGANLTRANLTGANLTRADLTGANLTGANLTGADLYGANLTGANLTGADLYGANLYGANLTGANLTGADLYGANLTGANLTGADLYGANLTGANLTGADLYGTKSLVKIMGAEPGNCYWKRFEKGLINNGYQFYVGLNILKDGKSFAADDRVVCSHPGFHFASRSWCAVFYPNRPLEAHIRIPMDANINEPWATDGKASASAIEILQVFDVTTGEDVTQQYVRPKATEQRGGQHNG
jgi:hypothetical protein